MIRVAPRSRWGRGLAELKRQLRLIESFGLTPSDLVLDVGSGQSPNLRADVLCDRFVSDASERACGASLVVDRPLVVADAEKLPFRDKAFDFVVCSHLLEHVRHPAKLLSELQRVAHRGYIETPSSVHERLYGNAFHKWYVDVRDGAIGLTPKAEARSSNGLQTWFRTLYENDPSFRDWVNANLDELGFLSRYHWSERIDFTVDGSLTDDGDFVFASGEANAPPNGQPKTLGQKVKRELSRWLRRRSTPSREELVGLLVCSRCRGAIRELEGGLCCEGGHRFERAGDLIFMVEPR